MCFKGPARTAAHEMWCTTATTNTASTVPIRPLTCFDGQARAVAYHVWCTTTTTTTLLGVPRSLSDKNSYVRLMNFWPIASSAIYNVIPCAIVGSKPWYRGGCVDDTPCRLGDAGIMMFLPWLVPPKEPPVQLREVGPDSGYLLTEVEATFTFMCSDVEPGVRTVAAEFWEAAAKIILLVLALSLLDRRCCSNVYRNSTARCCSSTC